MHMYKEDDLRRLQNYIYRYQRKIDKITATNYRRPFVVWYYRIKPDSARRYYGAGCGSSYPGTRRYITGESAIVGATKLRMSGHVVKIRKWDSVSQQWSDYNG